MKPVSALSLLLFAAVLAVAPAATLAVDSDPSPPVSNEHAAGNLAKADEHLATLKRICPASCEERDDLARSIERHRAGRK